MINVPRVQIDEGEKTRVVQVRLYDRGRPNRGDFFLAGRVQEEGRELFHRDHLRRLLTQLGITKIPTFMDRDKIESPLAATDEYCLTGVGTGFSWRDYSFGDVPKDEPNEYGGELDIEALRGLVPYFPRESNIFHDSDECEVLLGVGEGRE